MKSPADSHSVIFLARASLYSKKNLFSDTFRKHLLLAQFFKIDIILFNGMKFIFPGHVYVPDGVL